MSPSKKKTKKTATRKASKKPAAKKKTSKKKVSKKKAAKKPAAKKKAAKKPAAKKKASPKKTAKKAAAPAKTTKKAGKKATSAKAPTGKDKKGSRAGKGRPASKAVARGKPIPLSDVPHPKYGFKFECFACATRFYLMGKPEPVCPKCGADQRERPKESTTPAPKPKRPAIRPMAPLLDDDEEVATPEVEASATGEPREPDAMFDDAEVASVSEDADEAPRRKTGSDDDDA